MKKTILLLSAILIGLWGCGDTKKTKEETNTQEHEETPAPPKAIGKGMLVSDIHFNPFYDTSLVSQLIAADYTQWESIFEKSTVTSYGDYRIDTYYPLFKSSLEQMQKIEEKPDFIVITGDFISHNFEEVYYSITNTNNTDSFKKFIVKTESFIAAQLEAKFPNTPILPVLGNNDGFCGDYQIEANGPFLSFFAKLWSPRLQNAYNKNDFETTFAKGGYYAIGMPWDSTQVFIGLNSVFFSPSHFSSKHTNYCGTKPTMNSGKEELQWLAGVLADCQAQNKKVWLSYHIPPGMDIYNSRHCNKLTPMWEATFNDSFLQLVKQYKNTIVANFAGHTHMDDFRVIEDNGTPVSFIHITPSISPVNGNNPAIQHIEWNPADMTLTNNITHYFKGIETKGNNVWAPEYNFNTTYNEQGINPNTLSNVTQNIFSDKDSAREKYLQFYEVDKTNTVPSDWMAYWCGLNKLTEKEYKKCYCKK